MLRLVDCSLLVPPRTGPDGRSRYAMLETLRAYGAGLLAEAGEQDSADAALAGYTLQVAEEAAGRQASAGEVAAARWLDAEDATMRQAQAWAIKHDAAMPLRLAAALGWWWFLRGRLPGESQMLRQAAAHAETGSDRWCAAQFWLDWTALFAADLAGAFGHFTALRDAVAGRPPCRELSDALAGRSAALRNMGRLTEAADDARQALALARQAGYPAGEVMALAALGLIASYLEDHRDAVQQARHAEQITAGVPGWMAAVTNYAVTSVLIAAGDLAGAERACATGLARCREEPLRQAEQARGPARVKAARERGAAMSLDTAAEYALMKAQAPARTSGFVVAADEGQPFWFLNTLTITKVSSDHSNGQLSIVDHRVPPGFAPPPHFHQESDEALLILDGQLEGFCGDHPWRAGPGSLVFMPRAIPHGFTVSDAGPGRIIIVASPGGFDQFVATAGEPAPDLRLPEPAPPDPARLMQLAAAHGIQILPPPEP